MTQQLISNNELEITKQLLEANMRLDGRSAMKERIINIEFLNKPGIRIFYNSRSLALSSRRYYNSC